MAGTLTLLATLLLAGIPREPWPVDYVGCVEVNTVLDDEGEPTYTQALWLDIGGPNEIVDWRFFSSQMPPVAHWSLFEDKGKPRAIYVADPAAFRSHTYGDPEVKRRSIQPVMFRRRLTNSPE